MGRYKEIKTNISETILSMREVIFVGFIALFAGLSISLEIDNEKLLIQTDEAMGKYNETCYQLDQVNNAYEDLKEKYDYAVEIIRTSDRYSLSEEMEEQE